MKSIFLNDDKEKTEGKLCKIKLFRIIMIYFEGHLILVRIKYYNLFSIVLIILKFFFYVLKIYLNFIKFVL